MLASQYKRLIELLRRFVEAERESKDAAKNQESAIRDAAKTANESIREIPLGIAAAIRLAYEDVPAFEKTQRSKEYTQQHKVLVATWATFGATFLAFGAAAYYASIATRQAVIMQNTFKQGERSIKLDERPWVTVLDMEKQSARNGIDITVWFQNTGKTPARNLRVSASGEPVPKGVVPNLKEPVLPGVGVIAPGGRYHLVLQGTGPYDSRKNYLAVHGRLDLALRMRIP